MALSIGDNFQYQGRKPNFERDRYASLAEMKAVSQAVIDDGHIAFCEEDGHTYRYLSSLPEDAVTGKWRRMQEGAAVTIVPVLKADYNIAANPDPVQEHVYYITVGDGENLHTITADESVKWIDGTAPVLRANTVLVVSVLNNLAVWGIF